MIQSNEVPSSNHMEMEGLSRVLEFLDTNSLEVGSLITDRHTVSKFVSLSINNILT